jgi:hypothetical protein
MVGEEISYSFSTVTFVPEIFILKFKFLNFSEAWCECSYFVCLWGNPLANISLEVNQYSLPTAPKSTLINTVPYGI